MAIKRASRIGLSLGLSVSLGLLLAASSSFAQAIDPTAASLPVEDSKGKDSNGDTSGGSGVSPTGSASQTVSIVVPSGRRGLEPKLALSYSSGGSPRGGIAVGWSMGMPSIEVDVARTTATQRYYVSHLGGGARLQRNTSEPAAAGAERYRAERDASFAQYTFEPSTSQWWVRTLDGKTYTFAAHLQSTRWYLTSVEDPFGNRIVYQYEAQEAAGYRELVPVGIEYTSNPSHGIAAHARVVLSYAPMLSCGNGLPLGASFDRHFGAMRMTGSRRLTAIQTQVKDTATSGWRIVRQYTLGYDEAELGCAGSGLRYLESVSQVGFASDGSVTSAPTVTFAYGAKQRALPTEWTVAAQQSSTGDAWGPSKTLIDFDGDGWIDEVTMETRARCTLAVRPGTGVLQFASDAEVRRYPLLSAEWYDGVAASGSERCTLSGQYVERPLLRPNGACEVQTLTVNYRLVDWNGDGRIDVLSNLFESTDGQAPRDFFRPQSYPAIFLTDDSGSTQCGAHMHPIGLPGGSTSCACDTGFYPMEGGSCGTCPTGQQYDGQRCIPVDGPGLPDFRNPITPTVEQPPMPNGCLRPEAVAQRTAVGNQSGDYVFHLQLSRDEGLAPINAARAFTSPVPLPRNPMQFMGASVNWSEPEIPAYADLNGDGYLDMLSLYPDPRQPGALAHLGGASAPAIYVWLGGPLTGTRYTWRLPQWNQAPNTSNWDSARGFLDLIDAVRFVDFNGDGLPDLVAQLAGPSPQLAIAFNEGLTDANGGSFSAMQPLNAFLPGETTRTELFPALAVPSAPNSGYRAILSSFVDVDGDGLPELVTQSSPGSLQGLFSTRRAWRFGGGLLFGYRDLGTEWDALEEGVQFSWPSWQRVNDYLDVTGDGVPDAVTWTTGAARIRTAHSAATPPRLLTEVRNGQGGVVRFSYAPSTDPAVLQAEGRPMSAHYLVRSMTSDAGLGAPIVATYQYAAPHYGLDGPLDPGPIHLLGFEQSTTYQSGQQGWDSKATVRRYSFAPIGDDRSGHLVDERTIIKQVDGTLVPVTRIAIEWDGRPGISAFVYPRRKTVQTCQAIATTPSAAVCAPAGTVVTTETWSPIGALYGADGPVAYVRERVDTEESGNPQTTYVETAYELRAANWLSPAAGHRLFATRTERGAVVGTTKTAMARSETEFDGRGLPIASHQYLDASQRATTTSTFTATGQVATIQSPEQTASGDPEARTAYEYDERELYPMRTYDALKHVTEVSVDLGTGAVRSIRGPQLHRVCGTEGCSDVAEYQEHRLDGFGRVVEKKALVEAPLLPSGTMLRSIAWTTYVDSAPAAVHSVTLQDALAATYLRSERRLDGLGRPIAIISKHWNDAQQNEESKIEYDAGGQVARQYLPDPRATNTTSSVTYQFVRDGLGRTVSTTRPDGGGVETRYDGLTVTAVERGGQNGRVETRYSALGHAALVVETQDQGDAITQRQYDAVGRLSRIVDADGLKTSFEYDWAGHRTAIVRDGRRWTMRYDREGRVVAVVKPVPQGASVADYTSTTEYDALGRVLVETPASLGRKLGDQERLGIGARRYRYDGNLLTKVEFPFGEVEHGYDLRGRQVREEQRITVPKTSVTSNQHVTTQLDDAGDPIVVAWDDGTQWRTAYDEMGRVRDVSWVDPTSGALQSIASYVRNPSGRPLERTSLAGQRRTWKYDELGRVTYDRIWRPLDKVTQAERNYAYDGSEVAAVWGQILGVPADATFRYDRAHRLIAATGPSKYQAAIEYSLGGNVRSAAISGAEDVPDRNVDYVYSEIDPQAVARLRSRAGGADPAVVRYDLDGNAIERVTQAGTYAYEWDGDNQVRQVRGPQGLETYYFGLRGERIAAVGDEVKVWFGGSETHYTVDGAQKLRWLHVSAGEPLARIEDGARIELQFADALQNLMFTCDAQGKPSSAFLYGAFGELVLSDGSDSHARQFNGKENDRLAGLRHYGHRSYDPLLLRWVSADPLFRFVPDWAGAQSNLYTFAMNNPMRYYDPDGRQVAPSDDDSTSSNTSKDSSESDDTTDSGDRIDAETMEEVCARGEMWCEVAHKLDAAIANGTTHKRSAVDRYVEGVGEGIGDLGKGLWTGKMFVDEARIGIAHPDGHGSIKELPAALYRMAKSCVSDAGGAGRCTPGLLALVLTKKWPGAAAPSVEAGMERALIDAGGKDFLEEAARLRAESARRWGAPADAVGMARKADIRLVDRIVKDLGLSKEQRRLLHDEITRQDLTEEEIRAIAEDIAKNAPKGGTDD